MQVLRRPVQRVRLNQDYGLIRLEEVVVVREEIADETCFAQAVTAVAPSIAIYDAWLGDLYGNKFTSIQCGQTEKLWLYIDCNICYTNYITVECYAGKDTGWEHLIRKVENWEVPYGDNCYDAILSRCVPYFGEEDPRNGKVEEFLKLAGLDCTAKQVKVCVKVIYEG